MTERKPTGVSWESWIERQIRQAQERGDFDGLPGAGRPIDDLHAPRDENWWIRKKLERERIATLPPALAIRHERDEAMQRVTEARSEAQARDILEALNARIRRVNSTVTFGPSTSIGVVDVETVLQAWRRGRGQPSDAAPEARISPPAPR
ncbi:J-domain-containing protein [Egicoccus halophilus]|uniref:DUF1992 domain-containing protein n=1 Tax=Egicoccus halophilus TaxID=1670830 RepID=A0A8J3A8P4_9ACTN|nr:DUF1992 domain-containing protein [Egicoccus halophilus]GGI06771.1 DUF1992 domain-containing protein [Egicoccus halophilus]